MNPRTLSGANTDNNVMNARSMSGLNNHTTAGDVFLNGSPNAFTGTNTFDVNLPTSTVNPALSDIAANTLLNKNAADKLYGTGAGDVTQAGNNVFTGTNTFNVNRPTSTLTSTPSSTDFITRQDADSLFANSFDSRITINTTDIANNTVNIATANGNISQNTTDIATNTSAIATANSNITQNTTDIATNTTAIATANSNITQNTTDIASNTSAIATANTNITANTNAINTLDGEVVKTSGDQTISGVKTFNDVPICSTQPTSDSQLANKQYVDSKSGVDSTIGTIIEEQVQQHTANSPEPRNLNVVMSVSSQIADTLEVGNDASYITLTSTGIWSIQASFLVGSAGADNNSKKQIDQLMIGLGDNENYPNLGGDGTSNRIEGVAFGGDRVNYNSNKNYRSITITYVCDEVGQKIYLFSFIHVRSTQNSAQIVTVSLSTQPESTFNFMRAIKIAMLPD